MNNDINHYASPYYDPVKAREYYLRNRELKGRTKKGMSNNQKQAWDYAKDQISNEKKTKLDENSNVKKNATEKARADAAATRARISEYFKMLSEKLTDKSKEDRERISKETQAKIDALPPIPKGLSPSRRAKLQEQRNEKIAKIRGEGQSDRQELSENTKSTRSSFSENAKGKREAVRTELAGKINNIRTDFETAKQKIKDDYEKKYQNEYDNIRKQVK